jgi:putative addiction module component (TIGR02574 family)
MPGERKPMSIDDIEAAALELPEGERDELLERLSARRAPNPEIRQPWLDEAERRMELVRAGKMRLIDADDVLADPEFNDELASVALQIPADERAALADRLIASLTGGRRYDPAWEAEMNRRIDEIEAGTAKTVDADEVFAKLKARRHARSLSR